jgi:putative addiction module component (TIGR02574 family)
VLYEAEPKVTASNVAPMSTTINYRDLSIEDRLRLVQDIWISIAEEGPQELTPPWHREILDQRLASLERDPESTRPWSDVRKDLDAEFRR